MSTFTCHLRCMSPTQACASALSVGSCHKSINMSNSSLDLCVWVSALSRWLTMIQIPQSVSAVRTVNTRVQPFLQRKHSELCCPDINLADNFHMLSSSAMLLAQTGHFFFPVVCIVHPKTIILSLEMFFKTLWHYLKSRVAILSNKSYQSPFQRKSFHLVDIFAMPLGSYFRHERLTPVTWMGKYWKGFLTSQLNNTFQIINKIWHEPFHKCCFSCPHSIKEHVFQVAPAELRMQSVFVGNRASNSLCRDAIPDCLFYLQGGTSTILCIAVSPIHINMSELSWSIYSLVFAQYCWT